MKTLKEGSRRTGILKWWTILLIAAGIQIPVLTPLRAEATKKEITDKGITSAVEGGLTFEKGVFPNDVDVSTSQGITTLSGSVDNLLAKDRAVKIAESIRGVRGVVDRIIVTPVSRPDEDIRKDILTALLQDPATEAYQVAVGVKDAVATLTGSVGSYAEKQLAIRIAKGVKGLKEIRDDVGINYLTKRTDSEIDADVKTVLQWDIWINGDQINAAVKDGKMTLTGAVGSAIGKSRAFGDAWVNGVTSVDDSGVKIDPLLSDEARRKLKFAVRSDGEIKQAVQTALRLDPRVSAFSPEVTVEVRPRAGWVHSIQPRSQAQLPEPPAYAGVHGRAHNLGCRRRPCRCGSRAAGSPCLVGRPRYQ